MTVASFLDTDCQIQLDAVEGLTYRQSLGRHIRRSRGGGVRTKLHSENNR